jgi:transaldolase
MRIFVDTAKLDEIKQAKEWGICDGVTTNPSLLKKAVDYLKGKGKKIDMEDYIKEICKTLGRSRPVSLEVISLSSEEMIREAKILYKKFNPVARNVVIKIPINTATSEENNYEGLKAIEGLRKSGIPVNATLIMTPEQALLAVKVGASYVSPFAGRIDDYIRKNLGMKFEKGDYFPAEGLVRNGSKVDDHGIVSGVDLIRKVLEIFRKYDMKAKVIAASLRNSRQVREVAELGVDIATIPFAVIEEMTKHEKTKEGIIKFSEDTIPEYRKLFD